MKIKEEIYEFDASEKKFFSNLQKQPGIEKTVEILKTKLTKNLSGSGFELAKVFEQAGIMGSISHKNICFLRGAKFEKILEEYKQEREQKDDLITVDLVNRLESIIAKIPHVLSGITHITPNDEQERLRDINIYGINFLKKIEGVEPPIIYQNGIFINNDQFQELESIFKDCFKINTLQKLREKINKLGLSQVAKNQTTFPWKHIIEKLYTLTYKKRPSNISQRELPKSTYDDVNIDKYINTEVNIGFFLNKIQNVTPADVYVGQELAGYYYNSFGSLLTFTIGRSGSGFTNVTVESPIGMDIPRQGMVKKIEITDITNQGVIQGKII